MFEFYKDWGQALFFVALAAVGGFLGAVIRMLDAKEPIHWFVVFIEVMASAFSGGMVMMLCQALGVSVQFTGVIVGVCGWFGGRVTMTWLESRVRKVVSGEDGSS